MRSFGTSPDVVTEYEASVHAQAQRAGDPQAPDCTRCHGSHGAAPPGVGDVSKVCRQCHAQTREFFRQGPHQRGLAAHGLGECAACHGNHRVQPATTQLWVSTCTDCHPAGSEATRTGEKILALFTRAEEELGKARQAIAEGREAALDVADYEVRLSSAATFLTEAGPLSHALSTEPIEELTRKSRSLAQEVQAEVHDRIRVSESRGLVVVFFWFYIVITIAAIQYYKRAVR
jgi:predicted CXXCH cytochrome family protein